MPTSKKQLIRLGETKLMTPATMNIKTSLKEMSLKVNKVFASGQAIREASLTVLRPTVHGSERAGGKNIFYADSPQAAGY